MTSIIPTVDLVQGRPVVSSLKISEHFARRHDNVVRDIKRVITGISPEFAALNFEDCEYVGENGKPLPMYNLTRDGFTLVVMGYTGAEAMRLKEAYIRRFNEMEQALAGQERPMLPYAAGQDTLRRLINAWSDVAGISRGTARARVRREFGAERLDQIPAEDMPDAVDYVLRMLEQSRSAGQARKALPPALRQPSRAEVLGDLEKRLREEVVAFRQRVDPLYAQIQDAYGRRLFVGNAYRTPLNTARWNAYDSAITTLRAMLELGASSASSVGVLASLERAAECLPDPE